MKIHVDQDVATAFGEYTTFQFLDSRRDLRRVWPALHREVARRIIIHARDGGLALVPSDPDLYLVYYAAHEGDLRLAPEELSYGYGDDFAPGGYWEGGGRDIDSGSFTFAEGTLVLDVWDRERGVLVWRGIATGALKGDPRKSSVRLGKALERLMRRWEEMYGAGVRPQP